MESAVINFAIVCRVRSFSLGVPKANSCVSLVVFSLRRVSRSLAQTRINFPIAGLTAQAKQIEITANKFSPWHGAHTHTLRAAGGGRGKQFRTEEQRCQSIAKLKHFLDPFFECLPICIFV